MTRSDPPRDPMEEATAQGLRPGSPEWQTAVRRIRAEQETESGWKEAASLARAILERTRPASGDHPYLVRKGVPAPNGHVPKWWPLEYTGKMVLLRKGKVVEGRYQEGDTVLLAPKDLVLPMKALADGNPVVSYQRIPADPERPKLFLKNGRASRVFNSFLDRKPKKGETLYIAEGFATGWTVHHVTGAAVAISFTSGNLEAVAVDMRRRYPDVTIIIAADNDWKNAYNAGVLSARAAAAACGGQVAIPDFKDREGKSDFNDLFLAEGADAVRLWLDPERADEAATSAPMAVPFDPVAASPPPPPPPIDQGPELEPPPEEDDEEPMAPPRPVTWQDRAPFRCLGFDRGVYFYLPRGTGQITELTAAQHDRKWLLPLASASWWEQEFPAAKGADWHAVADALLRASHRAGVFRPERLRGRGCWPEEGPDGERTILLHLGDRLLPGGGKAFQDPERYEGTERLIYERLPRLTGPSSKRALDLEEARELLGLFQDLLWHDEASGTLLAGWSVLAPVCGALAWRPHVWVTGGAGAGKSVVLSRLVRPALGGMERYYEGGTTEAGIRQELRADALPVLYDEAEKQDARSDSRVQSVLALARSASSMDGAHTAKGTVGGQAMSFQVRSMFCLASIGGGVRQEADKTRISLLQLKSRGAVSPEERREHWERYRPRLDRVTKDTGRELISRTLGWLRDGRLRATLDVMRAQAAIQLGDQRSGDQYGTLFAGAWVLMADEPPEAEEARELIASHGLSTYIAEQAPEGLRVLRTILQTEVRVDTGQGPKTHAVGELVDACVTQTSLADDAGRWLKSHGLRVEARNGGWVLELANTSEWIASALRDTPYSDGWHTQLRTLPGVTQGAPRRYHAGLTSRVTIVPRDAYD